MNLIHFLTRDKNILTQLDQLPEAYLEYINQIAEECKDYTIFPSGSGGSIYIDNYIASLKLVRDYLCTTEIHMIKDHIFNLEVISDYKYIDRPDLLNGNTDYIINLLSIDNVDRFIDAAITWINNNIRHEANLETVGQVIKDKLADSVFKKAKQEDKTARFEAAKIARRERAREKTREASLATHEAFKKAYGREI